MIQINGHSFHVGITEMQRSVEKDYKYNLQTENGTTRSEIRSVRRVYTVTLGALTQAEYEALRQACVTAQDLVTVSLPDGQEQVTFDAQVEVEEDSLAYVDSDGTLKWDDLTLTFTDVSPLEVHA